MRTSYKKNRPFDFKLIDLVEPHPVLYQRSGLSNYEAMKAKTDTWAKIAEIMGCEVDFCLMRWNNLHYQFRKEFRRADTKGSTWPYLERLRFLADTPQRAKSKAKSKVKDAQEGPTGGPSLVIEEATPVQFVWETYEEGVADDQAFIVEEIIEEASDQIIQEEIIYEEEASPAEILYPPESFQQVDTLLAQLKEPHRTRAERRIMAFLLKCQLRSLSNQGTEDLSI
ncbi:hypothetical protein KR018_006736 [Drosophila ironensis]|nr:hypothetical protein KR018_006736 [Drosophila ironensis]